MSTPDPLTPPVAITRSEISKAARALERAKLRRRAVLKRLRSIEDDIRERGRVLRNLVADATAPASGDQLTVDETDLGGPVP